MTSEQAPHREIGGSSPQAARIYDYLLGGKDNYPADWEAAEKLKEVNPAAPLAVRANRAFMHRAVRFLAKELGIRQFLDIGTGIPTEPNLHQIVQAVDPACRVVYVDNDPIVHVHAQALMTSSPEGRATFIEADAREPGAILSAPELKEALDLSQPVVLSLIALLHFIPDERDPYGIVSQLVSALPSGSALVISHGTGDLLDPEVRRKGEEIYRKGGIEFQARNKAEVEQFFSGLELVEPGIKVAHRWRPDDSTELKDAEVSVWAGVALKP